jgi:hypothetical protein
VLPSVVIAVAAVIVSPAPARPQPSVPSTSAGSDGTQQIAERVAGEWRLSIPERAAQARVERAIDEATRQMLPIVSGIAAGRLRDANPLSRTLDIAVDRSEIRVAFDDATFETAPGHPRRMPQPGNEDVMVEVTQLIRGDHLEQVFATREGRRWNSFVPSADGERLELQAVLSSSQLPEPMRYSLPYERAD